MKKSTTLITTILAAAGIALAGAASVALAHEGGMGGKGHGAGQQAQHSPAERAAMQEKMRAAKTPEERHQIAQAEMAKRMGGQGAGHQHGQGAKAEGHQRGMGMGAGPRAGAGEHKHAQ